MKKKDLFSYPQLQFVHTRALKPDLLSQKSRSERARGLRDLRVCRKDLRPGSASHSWSLQKSEGERLRLSPLHLAMFMRALESELRYCVLNCTLSCPFTKQFHTNQRVWTEHVRVAQQHGNNVLCLFVAIICWDKQHLLQKGFCSVYSFIICMLLRVNIYY